MEGDVLEAIVPPNFLVSPSRHKIHCAAIALLNRIRHATIFQHLFGLIDKETTHLRIRILLYDLQFVLQIEERVVSLAFWSHSIVSFLLHTLATYLNKPVIYFFQILH
jgi:hypothetical protein